MWIVRYLSGLLVSVTLTDGVERAHKAADRAAERYAHVRGNGERAVPSDPGKVHGR